MMSEQDMQLFLEVGKDITEKKMRTRIRQTTAALHTWQNITDSAEAYTDAAERRSYVRECLETMSIDDLITIAGVMDSGLF